MAESINCAYCGASFTKSNNSQKNCSRTCTVRAAKARRNKCSVGDCQFISSAKGFCSTHYKRFVKHGSPIEIAKCITCGSKFERKKGILTCSVECSKAHALKREREYRASNQHVRERNINYNREWRKCNPDYSSRYNTSWRVKNREQYLKYHAQYRANNKELLRERYRIWEINNPGHARLWREANKERAREAVRRRRSQLKIVDNRLITEQDIIRLVRRFHGQCAYCSTVLDASYHIDHVIPVSRGGSNAIGNIVPACASCNTSKNDRTVTEWMHSKRLLPRKL